MQYVQDARISPLSESNKKQKNEPQCSLDYDLLHNFIFKFLRTRRQCIIGK